MERERLCALVTICRGLPQNFALCFVRWNWAGRCALDRMNYCQMRCDALFWQNAPTIQNGAPN